MTEDEAKTKTCHRTLAPVFVPDAGPLHFPAPCIGSACVAWRWEYNPLDGQRTSHGHCGLAGRPA